MVEVFEQQLAWVKPGLSAKIEVPAYPGQIWQGKVEYLYPELDPKTRTLKVRLQFPNPDQRLKPNMFAQVIIDGEPRSGILKIPQEALIVTGERKSVVVALGNGQFQPVDVTTGIQREGEVEILSGLQQGQQVVVSGHFLIDSESHLQASFLRLSPSQE
jgi:Cu(I)/Ag(I) efflux system membrane fusion protein